MIPTWLHDLSIAYLLLVALCAVVIAIDVVRHPQHMWIMDVVWPVTALFGTVWVTWQYFAYGRLATRKTMQAAMDGKEEPPSKRDTPFPVTVANGALHCGSGCTLGDIVAEWLVFAVPAVAVAFGYQTIFSDKIFAVWVVDYIFAYVFGIFFQYFTIAPMRGLGLGKGIIAAIKADTLSLTAWQVGMYGFMALAYFYFFGTLLGVTLQTDMVEFWFMMQIAMICGFLTAYPVNWWLIQSGIKERMYNGERSLVGPDSARARRLFVPGCDGRTGQHQGLRRRARHRRKPGRHAGPLLATSTTSGRSRSRNIARR